MKTKKLLSWLLVLCMVFTLMPMGSVVAQAVSTPLSGHEFACCDTTKDHYVIVTKVTQSSKADKYYYESNEWHKSASEQQTMPKTKFEDYNNVAVGGIYVLEDTQYVECKLPTYTVTFDANGHGTAPDSITDIAYEYTITAPTEPTAEGYVFGGWYKEAACENEWDFDSDEVTDDITLYAKWTEAGPVVCGLCVNCGHAFDHGPDEGKDCMACDVSPEGPCFGSGAQNAKACVLEKGHAGAHSATDPNGPKTYNVDDLQVGMIIKAGDTIKRGPKQTTAFLDFGGFVFGLCPRSLPGSSHNDLPEWVVKSPFPANTSGSVPGWYADTTNFKITKYVGSVFYLMPVHEWSYAADGDTITATCDKACGAETAHTVTLTLTPDGAERTKMDGLKEFNADTGLSVSEADVQIYKTETEGATTGGVLYTGTRESGHYYASLTVEGQTAVKAFESARVLSFSELTLGTVVNVGDVIVRDTTVLDFIRLRFGSSYFGMDYEDYDKAGYYLNMLNTWTMGDEFPAIRSADAPDWYETSQSFVVTKAIVAPLNSFDVYDIYLAPNHTCSYSVDGASIIATCDKTCGAESAHTATLTLNSTGYDTTAVEGMSYFNGVTGLNVTTADIKIYQTETEGAVTGGVELQGKPEKDCYYYASLTVGENTVVKAFVGRRVVTFAELEQGTVLSVGDAIARTSDTYGWFHIRDAYFGIYSSDYEDYYMTGATYWVVGSDIPAFSYGSMPSWYASTTTFVVKTVMCGSSKNYDVYLEPNHTWSYEADGAVITATCDRECGAEKAHVLTLTLSAGDVEMIVGSNATVTHTKVNGSGTLSTDMLGTPTVWSYQGKNYLVYNDILPASAGTSWNDAVAFVAKLNAAKYSGHDDWQLLSSDDMVIQYFNEGLYQQVSLGEVSYIWTAMEYPNDETQAWLLNLSRSKFTYYYKNSTDSDTGFVVVCGARAASVGIEEEIAAWKETFGSGSVPFIHYIGKAGSTTTLADTTVEPLALGSYTASLTVGGVTATKDFSITKLSQTLSFAESAVSKTYGDTSFTITVTGADTTVTYSSGNTQVATVDATTGAVTILKAGTVTITATAAEDETHAEATASYTLTVGKATPTVTAVPTASAITYGQTLANSTLTGGAASVQGAFAWTTSTTAPAVSDSGKTEYAVTFTPNDTTNYNTATCKVKVTVNKATGSGSVTMNGWTYGGTPSDPVPTSTTNGTGSVTYAYKVKNAADSTYAAATPTNAGTYTVKATFAATDNYTQATATADFTIAKASQDAPAASEGYTLDYTNETLKAKTGYEVSSTNGETATALTGNKVNPGSEAKTCYVRKPASDTNHADSAWTMITIPARPAATDLTGTMETIKNKRDASLSGVTSAMEYRMGTETNWTAGTGAVIANPDNLTIYVRTRATAGAFAGETQTIEFTPGDKLLTVTMGEAAQNVAYGAKVDKPANPEKSDYTFGGWYSDEECTQAWNFAIDTVKDNMTLYPKWIKNAVQKAAISGKVTENSVGVPGATVELYLGVGKIAAATTDASGNYSFDNVENGTYNIVVTKGDKTKTELVTVDSTGSFTADVELPTKAVSSKVEHKGTAVADAKSDIKETVVGGLDAVAVANAEEGKKVTVKLTVEPKAESDVASASEIKALAGSGKKVEFLDLSLTKTVDGTETPNFGDKNTQLLTIVIPFDFSGVNVSSVMILRQHGTDNVEKLTKNPVTGQEGYVVDAQAGTITLYAMKFSDYAVAYKEQSGNGGGSYAPGHTVTSDLKNVTKVTIDGKVVDSRYYTVSGGNIILSGEFMKTLANGKHTVKLYDGAKVATGIMTVSGNVAVISAATGDMGVALYAALSVSSILGMGWLGRKKRDDE